MDDIVRKIDWAGGTQADWQLLLHHEWLLTNGLGGYASGTVSGTVSRRYHGLLIAGLPAPLGRTVMLNHLAEFVRLRDARSLQFGGEDLQPEVGLSSNYLVEFRLENQLPVWRYEVEGIVLEKRVLLLHLQNTVHITYTLLQGEDGVKLELRPSMHFRPHENTVTTFNEQYILQVSGHRYEILSGPERPPLRLFLRGANAAFTLEGGTKREIFYRMEAERGYESKGALWSPGAFSVDLANKRNATLVASTESWNTLMALSPAEALESERQRRRWLIANAHPEARTDLGAELVLAADQFVIRPAGRIQDAARAHAAGDEVCTVIAGYHWFTDWGRDTMISLEGLTLTTRRFTEAGWILRTFAHYIRDGLIPNMFPEGENEGLYHTADATLWFFHALDRYVQITKDRSTLKLILPRLRDVVEHHQRGTHFGIGVDPADGLLRQGKEGYQLTWMDAKVDDWVVTPRRGKAVEINALWYNALRLMEEWVREEEGEGSAQPFAERAAKVRETFNSRFWYAPGGHLFDIIDGEQGDDPACRPNQVLAISLRHPVLDETRWDSVMQVVRDRLQTPVGLRSLAPGEPEYKPKYFGNLRVRDAAYHQGTVWGWLIGPYVDAWLKIHPEGRAEARSFLKGFAPHLGDACVGSISEIFDAESPFTPRGCIAQAWSVAEVLRCWVKTAQ